MDPSGAPLVQILITEIQQQVVASAFGRSRGRRNDQWDYAGHTLLPRCTQGWPPGLLLGLYKAGMYQAPHGYSFTRAPVHDAHILLLQHLHHCCSIPTSSSSSSSSRWGHIVWVSQACPTIPFPWENSQILDGRKVVEAEVTSTFIVNFIVVHNSHYILAFQDLLRQVVLKEIMLLLLDRDPKNRIFH